MRNKHILVKTKKEKTRGGSQLHRSNEAPSE